MNSHRPRLQNRGDGSTSRRRHDDVIRSFATDNSIRSKRNTTTLGGTTENFCFETKQLRAWLQVGPKPIRHVLAGAGGNETWPMKKETSRIVPPLLDRRRSRPRESGHQTDSSGYCPLILR